MFMYVCVYYDCKVNPSLMIILNIIQMYNSLRYLNQPVRN